LAHGNSLATYQLVAAICVGLLVSGCGASQCHEEDLSSLAPQIASLQLRGEISALLGPRLAIGEGGTAMVAWRAVASDASGPYDGIYAAELREHNWVAQTLVSRSPTAGYLPMAPHVTVNATGRAVVGWLSLVGDPPVPALRLARFDGSQWQPEILDVLVDQIGPTLGIRLLDDDRLVVVYETSDPVHPQVELAVSAGSLFAAAGVGFGSTVASVNCPRPDCTAGAAALALRGDGTGLIGWRQRSMLGQVYRAYAAPVDVNDQTTPIGSGVNLSVATIATDASAGTFALSVHQDGTVAAALREYFATPAPQDVMGGRVSASVQPSIGGSLTVQQEIGQPGVGLLDVPRVAANRGGTALFAWLANRAQPSTLEARIWGGVPERLEPDASQPPLSIDSGVVPGDQGQFGPRVALSYGDRVGGLLPRYRHPCGTLVYATSSVQSGEAVRWARVHLTPSGLSVRYPWVVDGPVTVDSGPGELSGIDLATFEDGSPVAVWIRREDDQVVLRAARYLPQLN
jgi:hypothetical protein